MMDVIRVAEWIWDHLGGVCNSLYHEQPNAEAERINVKIQAVTAIGRGYGKLGNLRVAVLFFCGGLNLSPQHSWWEQ